MLILSDGAGQSIFEVLLADVDRIDFPWWRWGTVCRIQAFGETFRVRLIPRQGGYLAVRIRGLGAELMGQLQDGSPSPNDIVAIWRGLLGGC